MATFTVQGVEQLLRQFAKLDDSVQRKYMGAAVGRAVKPEIQSIKAFTPVGPTGNLKQSVGVKVEKRRRKGGKYATVTAILGYRTGNKDKSHKGMHAWLLDAGTKDRVPKKGLAMRVPFETAIGYKYLLNKFAAKPTSALFFRRVKGIRASHRFRKWANANLSPLKDETVQQLGMALQKAISEQSRRDNLRAQGRSTR